MVRLYLEDWEKKIIQEKNASNEQKLINKYAGLKWKEDLDNDDAKIFVACTDEIHWEKPDDSPAITKYARFQPPIHDEYGYCIVGKSEDYDPTDDETFVYRLLNEELTLHTSILEYYEAYPDPTIEFLYKDDSSDDDDEVDPNWHWSFSKRNREKYQW